MSDRRAALRDDRPHVGVARRRAPASRRGSSQRAVVPSMPRRTSPVTWPSTGATSAAMSSISRRIRRARSTTRCAVVGQPALGAVDERRAELPLEAGDVAGDVGLHREQGPGRGRERAVVGDRHERGELADVHLLGTIAEHLNVLLARSTAMCVYSQAQRSTRYTPHVPLDGTHHVDPPSTGFRLRGPAPPAGLLPFSALQSPHVAVPPQRCTGAAFFDLDRTLLAGASGEAFSAAMQAGRVHVARPARASGCVYGLFNRIGETLPSMALARQAATLAKGRSRAAMRGRRRGRRRRAGGDGPAVRRRRSSSSTAPPAARSCWPRRRPYDLVKPLADRLGLDDVVATRYGVNADGTYDGTIVGPFVWAAGKLEAVRAWAAEHGVDLARELRLLRQLLRRAAARRPSARRSSSTPTRGWCCMATARRWPILNLDVSPGVVKIPVLGIELQRLALQFSRPGADAVRPVRHRGRRAHPGRRAGDPRRQPPQLLRPGGDVGGHRPAAGARCASSARRRCSTPRSSASWRRRWAASASTGAPGPTSRCRPPPTPSPAARWWRSCRRARSRVGRRSSTPS